MTAWLPIPMVSYALDRAGRPQRFWSRLRRWTALVDYARIVFSRWIQRRRRQRASATTMTSVLLVATSFGQEAGGVRCKGLCWSGREIRRRLTWHAGHRGPVCTAARRWRVEWMNEWMRHIRKTRRSASCVKCFSISTIPARVNMDRLPCGVARQPRYHWLTADLVLMIIRWEKQMQLHYLPQLSNRSSWRHSLPIMAVLRIQERPEIFKIKVS